MTPPGGPRPGENAREEIQFHLDMRVRELIDGGMSEADARRAALASFGDPRRVEADLARVDARVRRQQAVVELASSVVQDVRYAGRFLRANPGFSGIVAGTLALALGATTAIFSLLDATLLRRPAVTDPGSLVAVYTTCRAGAPRCASSYLDYVDYRDRTPLLDELAATTMLPAVSLGDDERGSSLVATSAVTGNFFTMLGVGTSRGRALSPDDDALGTTSAVTVLSDRFWRTYFGADPGIVGTAIRLSGVTFEVVGVATADFRGLTLGEEPDLFVPLHAMPILAPAGSVEGESFEQRGTRWIGRLVGRLTPGATPAEAQDALFALSESMRREDPDARGPRSVTVDPMGHVLAPIGAEESLPSFVWLLLGVVGVTLLLACANLANLMLARASTRTAEMGVRVAIGAGRARLVRQLVTESMMLSALGAAAGLALGLLLLRALTAFELPGGLPIGGLGASFDVRLLAVTGALTLVTTVLCGLAPALTATRRDVVEALRTGRSPESRRRARTRPALVAVQVALCVVLLVGSGLFVRSLSSALGTETGFDPSDLAVLRFNHGILRYTPAEAQVLAAALRERAAADTRVTSAAFATLVPFQGGGFMGTFTEVDGYEPAPDEEMRVDLVFTSPSYLETLGVPVLAGREIDASDIEGGAPIAVVNRAMAQRYWPSGEAIGHTLRLRGPDGSPLSIQVVGIAENVRWTGLREEPTNYVFLPYAQWAARAGAFLTVVARTSGDAGELLPDLRQEARALEPELTPQILTTMDGLIADLLMPQRLGTALLSAFGALALLLASIGIAGVVAYNVREQRRSIGVRLALGARGSQVLGMVVRGMAAPVGAGLAVGLAVATVLDDAVERFLYGVVPGDPVTYATISGALVAVALAATLLPAREATRVDPLRVLKSE